MSVMGSVILSFYYLNVFTLYMPELVISYNSLEWYFIMLYGHMFNVVA
jgi:hypothetical protein